MLNNPKSRVSSICLLCTVLAKVFHTGLSYKYCSLAYFADNEFSGITLDLNSIQIRFPLRNNCELVDCFNF